MSTQQQRTISTAPGSTGLSLPLLAEAISKIAPFETMVIGPSGMMVEKNIKTAGTPRAIIDALAPHNIANAELTIKRFAGGELVITITPPCANPHPRDTPED